MSDETKPSAPAPSGGRGKLLIIVLAVVVSGGGGAAAFFMMRGGHGETAHAEPAPAEATPGLVSLDTFLVNLQDPNRDRFMKATMRLAITPESAALEVKASDLMLARIRDRILTLLMAKSFDELSNPLGKEGLRLEIRAQVDDLLEHGEVHEVMFSEFVVQ